MRTLLSLFALALVVSSAEAQRGSMGRGADSSRRPPAELDRRIQERMGELLREQLRLSDAQVRQMREHSARFGPRRIALGRDDRATRQSLRDAMRVKDSVNQAEVGTLLDRVLELQRERLSLLEDEQRALSQFLTPVQRARYFAFEEELTRRSDELRRAAESHEAGRGRGPGAPDGRRPPPPPTARRVPPPAD